MVVEVVAIIHSAKYFPTVYWISIFKERQLSKWMEFLDPLFKPSPMVAKIVRTCPFNSNALNRRYYLKVHTFPVGIPQDSSLPRWCGQVRRVPGALEPTFSVIFFATKKKKKKKRGGGTNENLNKFAGKSWNLKMKASNNPPIFEWEPESFRF